MGIYPLILDKAERRHSDVTVDDGLGETSQNHPISCGCKTLNGCVWTCMMFTPMCLPAWIRFWWNLIISWQRRVYWIKLENFGFCGDVIYRLVCSPVNYRVTSSILIHEMLIFGSQMIPGPLTKQMTGWWWLEHGFYDFPFSWECHHPNWRTQSIILKKSPSRGGIPHWHMRPLSYMSHGLSPLLKISQANHLYIAIK